MHMIHRVLAGFFVGLSVFASAWAQVPALLEVPQDVLEPAYTTLHRDRRDLFTRLSTLKQRAQVFSAACASVEKDSADAQRCRQQQAELVSLRAAYAIDVEAFNARVSQATSKNPAEVSPPIWIGGEPQYTANALKDGDQSLAIKDWEAAALCYEEVLRFYPDNADVQKKLALVKQERDVERQRYAEQKRQYTHYDNGLVEGTTRVIGYNMPTGFDERQRAESGAKLDKLLLLAEKDPAAFRSLKNYTFIIGVGTTYSIEDLFRRVWPGDQFNQGETSTQQPLYASLRGRQFNQLDCHSNGAMVCLAALKVNDVKAAHVRLYGPQITPASVKRWQQLIESGKIRSLQIVINRGDPVARLAYATSFQAAPTTLGGVLLSDDLLATDVKKRAPGIQFKFAACPQRSSGLAGFFDTDCHDIRLYQANAGK